MKREREREKENKEKEEINNWCMDYSENGITAPCLAAEQGTAPTAPATYETHE